MSDLRWRFLKEEISKRTRHDRAMTFSDFRDIMKIVEEKERRRSWFDDGYGKSIGSMTGDDD